MKYDTHFWLIPFCAFLAGYLLFYYLWYVPAIETPLLIGKPIKHAIQALSDANLNIRILGQKEDKDLPDGTVMSQIPSPGQKIKPGQTIFCTLSYKKDAEKTPNLEGKTVKNAEEIVREKGLFLKKIFLATDYPKEHCFAQSPAANSLLEQKTITAYFAAKGSNIVIFPNFKKSKVTEVLAFLQPYGLEPIIFHRFAAQQGHQCIHCTVIDQKPLPGSLVDLNQPFNIQLQTQ
ncbi:MAG: PASTA domain-containing protein [Candidatus Babeliales bacterium]